MERDEILAEIRKHYKNFTSVVDATNEQEIVSQSSTNVLNIDDKQHLVFEFDRKDVIANFKPSKITAIRQPGYSNDLDLMLSNIKEVFEALYKAGFLTNGCEISFGGGGRSSLNIRVCV